TRPETIITSACRGLARNTSEPKRARSLRDDVAFIISIAQHARPNVAGQSDDLRAQLIKESRRVVKTSGSAAEMTFSRPIRTQIRPLSSGVECVAVQRRQASELQPRLQAERVRSNQRRLS